MPSFDPAEHPRGAGGRFTNKDRDDPGQVLDRGHHLDVELPEDVQELIDAIRGAGMRPLLVGGSVRDAALGVQPKDLDFEVYEADGGVPELLAAASGVGRVNEVGRAFGILKMRLRGGSDVDLSIPRRENKVGVGHRAFEVSLDAGMTVEEAALRRDFTINAMSWDPATGELLDPHGGMDDLRDRRLRAVSDAFDEDPLRVLRGMQFASRFGMRFDPDTAERCRRLRDEAASLPVERTRQEWAKWANKSTVPSLGLQALVDTGWDRVIPGVGGPASDDIVQASVDDMALAADLHGLNRQVMMCAELARHMEQHHAKLFLRQAIEGDKLQYRAYALAIGHLSRTGDSDLRRAARDTRTTVTERAVFHGLPDVLERARELGVDQAPEPDMVNGSDILAATGRPPGPWMSRAVSATRKAQDRRKFSDRESGLAWLRTQSFEEDE